MITIFQGESVAWQCHVEDNNSAIIADDIIGKGLHKLTFTRDETTASTHMLLYVRHEYFEKV